MVRVVAKNIIKGKHIAEAEKLFRELIAATVKEKGCIEYRLFVKKDQPGLYIFVEEWETEADLQNHFAAEHFKRIVPMLGELKAEEGEVLVLEEFK